MGEVCVTKAIKSVAENTSSQVSNLEDSILDIAGAVGRTRTMMVGMQENLRSIESQTTKAELVSPQMEMLSQMRAQICANSALIQEVLKVEF